MQGEYPRQMSKIIASKKRGNSSNGTTFFILYGYFELSIPAKNHFLKQLKFSIFKIVDKRTLKAGINILAPSKILSNGCCNSIIFSKREWPHRMRWLVKVDAKGLLSELENMRLLYHKWITVRSIRLMGYRQYWAGWLQIQKAVHQEIIFLLNFSSCSIKALHSSGEASFE